MGRPALADAPPVATPERLAAAAEVEFGRRGFAAARLEDVARRAGIRRPSLLYHYPTKQALYEAVIGRVFGELETVLEVAVTSSAPAASRFEALVRAFSDFLERRPVFASLVLRELMDGRGSGRALLRTRLVPTLDRVEEWVRGTTGDRLPDGWPVRAALLQTASGVLLHAAAGSLREPLWGDAHDPVTLARQLLPGLDEET